MNSLTEARADIKALTALLTTDTPVTFPVINAVWRWFLDVEISLPVQTMPMDDKARRDLAIEICTEMDAAFADLEKQHHLTGDITDHPAVTTVNNLWRELATLHGDLLNTSIQTVPEEMRELIEENALQMIAETSGLDVAEAVDHVRNNPVARMMLRRSGIDPDVVLARFDADPDHYL